jgi:hypothetical protein
LANLAEINGAGQATAFNEGGRFCQLSWGQLKGGQARSPGRPSDWELDTATLIQHKRNLHLDVERLAPDPLRRNPPAKADSRSVKTLRDEHEHAPRLRQQIGGIRIAQLDSSATSLDNQE